MQVQLEAAGIGPLLDLSGESWHAVKHIHTVNLGPDMPPADKHAAAQLPAVAPCSSSGPCLSTPSQLEGAGTLYMAAAERAVTVVDSRHSAGQQQAYPAASEAAVGSLQDHVYSNSHSCSHSPLLLSLEHTPAATPPAAASAAPASLLPLASMSYPATAAATATLSASAANSAGLFLQLTGAAAVAARASHTDHIFGVGAPCSSAGHMQEGSSLLQQLQQLTCSLQEAVRLQDELQLQVQLRLLSSFPVTAELLLLSQAGAVVQQLLLQQRKHQQHQQRQWHGGAVAHDAAADARQLLSRWKAVLAAEVAAANSSMQHKALQELLRDLPAPQQQRFLCQPSAVITAAAATGRRTNTPQQQPLQQQQQQLLQPQPVLPPQPAVCHAGTAKQLAPRATAAAAAAAPAPAKRKLSSTKLLSPAEKLQRLLNPSAAEQQAAAAVPTAALAAAAELPAEAAKPGRQRRVKQQQGQLPPNGLLQQNGAERMLPQKLQKQQLQKQQLQKPPGAGGIIQRSRASKSCKLLQQQASLPPASCLPQVTAAAAAAAAGPAADTQRVASGSNGVASQPLVQQQQQGTSGKNGVTRPGVHASWLAVLSGNRKASGDDSSSAAQGSCCRTPDTPAPAAAATGGGTCKGQQHNIMWGAGAKALRAAAKVTPHHQHHADGHASSHTAHHAHTNKQHAPHGHPVNGSAGQMHDSRNSSSAAAAGRAANGHAAGRMSPPPARHVTVVRHGCSSSSAAAAGCGLLADMQQSSEAASTARAGAVVPGPARLAAGYVNGASCWQPDSDLCGDAAAATAAAGAAAAEMSGLRANGMTAVGRAAAGSMQQCGSGLWSLEFVLQGGDQDEEDEEEDVMLVDLRQQQHEGMMLPAVGDVGGLLLGPALV